MALERAGLPPGLTQAPSYDAKAVLGTFELSLRKSKSCPQAATANSEAPSVLSKLRGPLGL